MLEKLTLKSKTQAVYLSIGVVLVTLGIGYLLGTDLKQNWIIFTAVLFAGFIFLVFGFASNADGLKIAGTFVSGTGLSLIYFSNTHLPANPVKQIGFGILLLVCCFIMLTIVLGGVKRKSRLWPLIPAGVLFPISIIYLLEKLTLLHFVLACSVGIGMALLGWGLVRGWFGLVIPGCILVTTGPGIFFAWKPEANPDGLAQTGIMLVWFAVGWVLIALISRFLFAQVIWWPLIPGGVLAFVGWGLALGANSSKALGFVGDSGSIIVILIGFYLLLLRKDVHR
ncbi:MAG: hypothetical protein ABFD14_10235 [Anaerolineaceae bacterium]